MINLRNVRKFYGALEVIKGVDITVEDGEFAVFVGPSGCGKSTLLRMIAYLEGIDDGDLILNGKRINDVPPDKRGIAMVFQSYALYPHMSVAENIGFSLSLKKVPEAEIRLNKWRVLPRSCSSPTISTAARPLFPAASASAWRSAAPSSRSWR